MDRVENGPVMRSLGVMVATFVVAAAAGWLWTLALGLVWGSVLGAACGLVVVLGGLWWWSGRGSRQVS